LSTIIAILAAVYWSLRYSRRLSIRVSESPRYIAKSMNLAGCYRAFGDAGIRHSARAGRAAFLSCAYDVVTDWRWFDETAGGRFEKIVREIAPPRLADQAMALYQKDRLGLLSNDGLERGEIALQFVCELMETTRSFTPFDRKELGVLCQIVDDVIDLEGDLSRGELNCLLTANRTRHLESLLRAMPQLRLVFVRSGPMRLALAQAESRARVLCEEPFDPYSRAALPGYVDVEGLRPVSTHHLDQG